MIIETENNIIREEEAFEMRKTERRIYKMYQ